ncbi:hypothetical protein BDY21DRAFT_342816 [Lineolata rhizophorae]|uniref:DUF676 domain-containing protein n=1 Tax=Lineolata rhizophorae TaxID=578093 RepID=A0A6A6P1C2_9PEZI|nr:hypothetical protein BDY21DRAFT_342816 [Lineolata rhizophorae]
MEAIRNTPLGLITVYEGYDPEIDIVAVHGLGARPEWAWTRRVEAPGGKMKEVKWLSDPNLLPARLPRSRVMTFNYESRWHRNAPKHRKTSVADNLLRCLEEQRQNNPRVRNRPLLFIGHSYGGIVIEQLIVHTLHREIGYIRKATAGIVFLGTPHRGTDVQSWGELMAVMGQKMGLGSHNEILKELRADSENLKDMSSAFSRWVNRASVPIVCGVELYETDYGKRLGGILPMKAMVVPEDSACIDGHPRLYLYEDHLKLNKYCGPNDSSYRAVSSQLVDMALTAIPTVRGRFGRTQPTSYRLPPNGRKR